MPWVVNLSIEAAWEGRFPEPSMDSNGHRKSPVCISIHTPGGKGDKSGTGGAINKRRLHDVLHIAFDDYSDEAKVPDKKLFESAFDRELKLFDCTLAAIVLIFMEENRGRDFVVHCEAGISRSAAVAEFILKKYPEYEDRGGHRVPNRMVLRHLISFSGSDPAWYEEIVRKCYGDRADTILGLSRIITS